MLKQVPLGSNHSGISGVGSGVGSGVVGTVSGVAISSSTMEEEVTSGVEVVSDVDVLHPERISIIATRLMIVAAESIIMMLEMIDFFFMIYLPFLIKIGFVIFTSTQYNNT